MANKTDDKARGLKILWSGTFESSDLSTYISSLQNQEMVRRSQVRLLKHPLLGAGCAQLHVCIMRVYIGL